MRASALLELPFVTVGVRAVPPLAQKQERAKDGAPSYCGGFVKSGPPERVRVPRTVLWWGVFLKELHARCHT